MDVLKIQTRAQTEFVDITADVQVAVSNTGVKDGVVTIFLPHTTAGVTINENADPDVTADLELILDRMVPWTGGYAHVEGNSAAHVKASMMGASAQVIVQDGRLALGTWQAIYFCEFDGPRHRRCIVTALGR